MTALPIFPNLPGRGWSVKKSPEFVTRSRRGVSGRETRIADQPLPIWHFSLTHPLLRDKNDTRGGNGIGTGFDELRTLMGFYLGCQGGFAPFAFNDPSDNSVTGQSVATGDGVSASFQLQRSMGGFNEPISDFNVLSQVYYNGTAQGAVNFSAGPTSNPGLLTDTRGPVPAAAVVTADFTYYFRCRFSDDTAEFENVMYQIWQQGEIKFQSLIQV